MINLSQWVCFTFAEEMDWDKNGMVNFKEFLFAFTGWVGIDDNEDEEEGGEKVWINQYLWVSPDIADYDAWYWSFSGFQSSFMFVFPIITMLI